MNQIERLRQTIRDAHGLESTYVESVPIEESLRGEKLWSGTVDVFRVSGHPKAQYAYAWSYHADSGHTRRIAVLGVPPINSASSAVATVVAAEGTKKPAPRR